MPIARGQITIVDLNDAKSMSLYLGSNQPLTQIFNKENSSYVPNWTASPFLVVTPELCIRYNNKRYQPIKSRLTYDQRRRDNGFGGTVAAAAPYA
ncbi:MAG: hypothetical protein ACLTTW_04360 [Coprobacter sp.]